MGVEVSSSFAPVESQSVEATLSSTPPIDASKPPSSAGGQVPVASAVAEQVAPAIPSDEYEVSSPFMLCDVIIEIQYMSYEFLIGVI